MKVLSFALSEALETTSQIYSILGLYELSSICLGCFIIGGVEIKAPRCVSRPSHMRKKRLAGPCRNTSIAEQLPARWCRARAYIYKPNTHFRQNNQWSQSSTDARSSMVSPEMSR